MSKEETPEEQEQTGDQPQETNLPQPDVEEAEEIPLATSFAEIVTDKDILARLNDIGFHTPTEVQAKSLAPAVKGGDLIIQAQTGGGKTLAFVIPLLHKLNSLKQKDTSSTFALIVAPTRELALQITEVISQLDSTLDPVLLIGGADSASQRNKLTKDARVVVGTPGRLLDMLRRRNLQLGKCRFFVLDEADEMLSMGFIEDVRAILSRLPNKRQGLLVSATITGRVEMLAHSFLNKPTRVVVGDDPDEAPDIEHCYVEVGGDLMAKPSALCDLIETTRPRSAIIFCNTKSDTKLLEALMRRRGFDARRINSDLTQGQRDRIMKKIRAGDLQFLVATDIAARGIDIEQIDLVVNYNIHDQSESYTHRTGRTGRAGRSGKAISLVGPRDHGAFHYLKKVLDVEFKKIELPSDDELAEASLAHLYEVVREAKIEVKDRHNCVARKLIKELGGIEEPTEELEAFVAKLCHHTIEHFVNLDALSLEDEIEKETRSEKKNEKNRDRDDSKRSSKRERSEKGDSRKRRDNNSEGSEKRSKRRQDGDKDKSKESEERSSRKKSSDKPDPKEDVRLYIGQGHAHGMTPDIFRNISSEMADIDNRDLKNLTIREHYGFVDVKRFTADSIAKNLNGIEYNGHTLPIELAVVLSSRRPRRDDSKRGGDRRRNDNRRGGNKDGRRRSQSDSGRGRSSRR
jgi:ATP-dependent RNA helicase DeaD